MGSCFELRDGGDMHNAVEKERLLGSVCFVGFVGDPGAARNSSSAKPHHKGIVKHPRLTHTLRSIRRGLPSLPAGVREQEASSTILWAASKNSLLQRIRRRELRP